MQFHMKEDKKMINNLSQLKKAINNGAIFTIIKHYIKPEYTA